MSNPNPVKKFQKGQSGNPKGGRKMPEDIKQARKMSFDDMCRTVVKVRGMTPADVKKQNLDSLPLGERVIIHAYMKYDAQGVKIYEDRLWGKAKESVDLTTNGNSLNKIEIVGVLPIVKDDGK